MVLNRLWVQYNVSLRTNHFKEFIISEAFKSEIRLTINGIYLFRQHNGIWGGGIHNPPKVLGATIGMTLKSLPDVGIDIEAPKQNNEFRHNWSGP